jgi:nitroreductase
MDAIECIQTRRSVRDFSDKKVPKEIIQKLIDAAVMAPSAMNRQPWQFVVIEGKEKLGHFAEIAYEQLQIMVKAENMPLRLKGPEAIFHNAPCVILICGDKDWRWLKEDCNLAAENLMLAAHSMGLGSCWIGFAKGLNNDAEAKQELGIPENLLIAVPLIVGYPKNELPKPPKREVKILKWLK